MRSFQVVATIADPEKWAPESIAAAKAAGSDDYWAWAMAQLRERVTDVVYEFGDQYPDLFACQPDVF